MGIEHIRQTRNVPAKVGGRVRYTGSANGVTRYGTITGGRSGYLQIRLDGDKHARNYHPTWELEYIDAALITTSERP